MTSTGIPIELLFTASGALLVAIYADIKYQLRSLQKSASRRDTILVRICDKLKITFPGD